MILCIEGCKFFIKKINSFKKVSPQTKKNEDLKTEVLDNAGDLFNDLYYICMEKYKEEKNVFNKKDMNKFDYTKLKLTNDYGQESEEEKEQTDKKSDKKEPPKKTNKK